MVDGRMGVDGAQGVSLLQHTAGERKKGDAIAGAVRELGGGAHARQSAWAKLKRLRLQGRTASATIGYRLQQHASRLRELVDSEAGLAKIEWDLARDDRCLWHTLRVREGRGGGSPRRDHMIGASETVAKDGGSEGSRSMPLRDTGYERMRGE